MSPAEIACQSWSITRGKGPVPNVENAAMSAASSTSSPTPPTNMVRFVFVPSSMWPKGGSGRENVATFPDYLFHRRRRWARRRHQPPAGRANDPSRSLPPSLPCLFQTN